MKKEILDKVIDAIADAIPSDYGYNADEDYAVGADDIADSICNSCGLDVTFAYGVSKSAYIFEELDEVIKIPFRGRYYSEYNYDTDEWGETSFTEFRNAAREYDTDRSTWDYCEEELHVYDLAVEAGVECFFPKIEEVAILKNGIPIYIQKKVSSFHDFDFHKITNEAFIKAKELSCDRCYRTTFLDWIAAAILVAGEEKVAKLLDFIREVGISDLHCGNLGLTDDGLPVILDSADWRDSEW